MIDPLRSAREKLFADHYRIVPVIAGNFMWTPDICQVGALGLWKACLAYDATKGKFSTFAWRYVYGAIFNYIRDTQYTHRRGLRCTHKQQPCPNLAKCEGHLRQDEEFVEELYDPASPRGLEDVAMDSIILKEILQDLPHKQQIALLLQVGYAIRQVDVAHRLHHSQKHISRLVSAALRSARTAAQRRGYLH